MISIRGFGSRLAQAVIELLPPGEKVRHVERGDCETTAERHLFCQGVLYREKISRLSNHQIAESFIANAATTIRQCDAILAVNPEARICVVGSESAYTWSFDGAYAGSKAALHAYVETKKLAHPGQQLICVAPTIIADAGMTTRRYDIGTVNQRAADSRIGRWLTCAEVASFIHYLLYIDRGYISGHVIRMNGGPQ